MHIVCAIACMAAFFYGRIPVSEIKKSICPYDCPSTCGFLMEVENGKIISVRNDPEHPVSCSGICRKTARYQDSIHSEKRILTPLKRTGKKGSGSFTPITWEEAIRCITDRWKELIAEYGPEAIWPWRYSGVMSDIQRHCGDAFFNRLGRHSVLIEPPIESVEICADSRETLLARHITGPPGARERTEKING